jgi:putative Holliday junction resolvase
MTTSFIDRRFYRSGWNREDVKPVSSVQFGYSVPMRILALDFGERRIGLATCDTTGQVVAARRTILRKSDAAAAREIAAFCGEEEVERIVLGLPRSPEGRESPIAARIRSFGQKLSREAELPVEYHEETLTSWEAERGRGRAPRSREEIDREAAAILLNDYLSAQAERRR